MDLKAIYVIVPVFNGVKYLRESLISILDQDYINIKVIVIDDASSDGSWDIISQFAFEYRDTFIVLRNEKNLGVAKSRSLGLDLVPSSAYVVFLDCDDIYLTYNELSTMVVSLDESGADLCTFDYFLTDENLASRIYVKGRKTSLFNMAVRNYVGNQSVIVKSEVFSNGLRPVAKPHEDYIMWFQIILSGAKTSHINQPVVAKRRHSNALTHNKIKSALWHYQAVSYLFRSSKRNYVKCLLIVGAVIYLFSQFALVFKRKKI